MCKYAKAVYYFDSVLRHISTSLRVKAQGETADSFRRDILLEIADVIGDISDRALHNEITNNFDEFEFTLATKNRTSQTNKDITDDPNKI